MAAISRPNITSGAEARAIEPQPLAQAAEEPATVPPTIQAHSANTAKPNGNGQAKGPFMMPHAWERDGQSSDPHVPEASSPPESASRPVTIADLLRAWGIAKPVFAVVLLFMGWLVHVLYSGGYFSLPAPQIAVDRNLYTQEITNQNFLNQINNMRSTLDSHSATLSNVSGLLFEQGKTLARIETYLTGALSSASAPASPLPLAFQKSGKLNLSTNIATSGWTAKQSDD